MNPQFDGQPRAPTYMQPFDQQNAFNSYGQTNTQAQAQNENASPFGYQNPGQQNGLSNNFPVPNQSIPQVQSNSSVPPNSHMINNQMSRDFNAMHIQNQYNAPSSGQPTKFPQSYPPQQQAFPPSRTSSGRPSPITAGQPMPTNPPFNYQNFQKCNVPPNAQMQQPRSNTPGGNSSSHPSNSNLLTSCASNPPTFSTFPASAQSRNVCTVPPQPSNAPPSFQHTPAVPQQSFNSNPPAGLNSHQGTNSVASFPSNPPRLDSSSPTPSSFASNANPNSNFSQNPQSFVSNSSSASYTQNPSPNFTHNANSRCNTNSAAFPPPNSTSNANSSSLQTNPPPRFAPNTNSTSFPRNPSHNFASNSTGLPPNPQANFTPGYPPHSQTNLASESTNLPPNPQANFNPNATGFPPHSQPNFISNANSTSMPPNPQQNFGSNSTGLPPNSQATFGSNSTGLPPNSQQHFASNPTGFPPHSQQNVASNPAGFPPNPPGSNTTAQFASNQMPPTSYNQTYPSNLQQTSRTFSPEPTENHMQATRPPTLTQQPLARIPQSYTNGAGIPNGNADVPPPSGVYGRRYPSSNDGYASQYGQSADNAYQQNRQQPQRKLDPDNMPSPIQVIEEDQKTRSGTFETSKRGAIPPLVTTDFTVVDQGNCSPRFIRSSIYNVPTTADALKQTQVPFALAISPFARVLQNELPPPLVNTGEDGPVRCHRCRAYMSPFMQFIDAGRRFQCLLCKTTSEVPVHYFSHLDHMGQRADKHTRAELCLGSYELTVNKDYCKEGKFPNVPAFIFLIDVSYNSMRSGMAKTVCDNMKTLLASLPKEEGMAESAMKVGFVTYSTAIHFYNINKNLAQPQMLVVSDVQDMFMPLLDGFLVHPSESAHVIDSLMEQIPSMFMDTKDTETVLGPAIQAGLEALKAAECAGKLFVFHTTMPLAEAPGKLKNRDDRKLLGTDKEKALLSPQIPFYNNLGQECVKAGCSVDLFLFNNAYIDIATLGQVCRLTGGQLFKYTYFQADLDGDRFIRDLQRQIEKPIAFDAVLRVRTSTGIRPTDFHGSFFMSNTTDVEFGSVTCDKSVSVEVKYDDKLAEEEGVHVQCAVLYTSCAGQRRLRVHNLALGTCTQMADLFRNCELDTIMNYLLKEAVRRVTDESPKQIKDYLVSRCAQMLACYRRNCAQTSSAGQLILPECMKLLPLYVNCLSKCDAISGGQEMTTDDRSYIMLAALTMTVESSAAYLYPRLLNMREMKLDPDSENVELPPSLRCSVERLAEDGFYILENGLNMFLWIGANADPEFVQDVFGVPSVASIDPQKMELMPLNNIVSETVRKIIHKIQTQRQKNLKLYIVRQGDKLELLFRMLLVEDRTTDGSVSYVDFLCHLHKEIRMLLQ